MATMYLENQQMAEAFVRADARLWAQAAAACLQTDCSP